jgi:hypothetical protein
MPEANELVLMTSLLVRVTEAALLKQAEAIRIPARARALGEEVVRMDKVAMLGSFMSSACLRSLTAWKTARDPSRKAPAVNYPKR